MADTREGGCLMQQYADQADRPPHRRIENIHVRLAKSGFPLFQSTGPGTSIITNPETGRSVTVRFTGAVKDLTVVDNGDGTITVRTA
jgi:hypothetical protein